MLFGFGATRREVGTEDLPSVAYFRDPNVFAIQWRKMWSKLFKRSLTSAISPLPPRSQQTHTDVSPSICGEGLETTIRHPKFIVKQRDSLPC
jgi:hypothetical protein